MILYDQVSDIDWFYEGIMTADEMLANEEKRILFEEPCVLYDNGNGKVFRFETLRSAWDRLYVEQDPNKAFEILQGTYVDPMQAQLDTLVGIFSNNYNEESE